MIRIAGRGLTSGARYIMLVLDVENVRRMIEGDPIRLDLQFLAPDVISEPLLLVVEAPSDFDARAADLLKQASEQGSRMFTISEPPKGVM